MHFLRRCFSTEPSLRLVRSLIDEMRLYEARDVLSELSERLSDGESGKEANESDLSDQLRELDRNIERVERDMARFRFHGEQDGKKEKKNFLFHRSSQQKRELPLLNDTVHVERFGEGQLQLVASRNIEYEECVFRESPVAVLPLDGQCCSACLRPLVRRKLFAHDGKEIRLGSNERVEQMFEESGLPKMELRDDEFCSDACRKIGYYKPDEKIGGVDEISKLMNRIVPRDRRRILKSLYTPALPFPDEPEHLSEDDALLWRCVRANSIEVEMSALSLALDVTRSNVSPIVMNQDVSHGLVLFFCASLCNHSCTAANIAPVLLDGIFETPFVAQRDIKKGEPILFDYAATVDDARDKRIKNFITHRFVCDC